VHLLSEVSLEETRVEETQHSLFQQFVLRVVRAFLLEWSEADELPLDDMVGKFCLFLYIVDPISSTSLIDAFPNNAEL
jgi:hypothetical protein